MLAILNSNYVVQKLNADLQLMGQKGSRRLASTIPKEFVFQRFLIQTQYIFHKWVGVETELSLSSLISLDAQKEKWGILQQKYIRGSQDW